MNQEVILQTYRFVFSNEIIDILSTFAKIHEHDDRKTFKEEWETWSSDEQIKSLINEEIKRLKNSGYQGDVIDKMFKSARYYYRSKPLIKEKNINHQRKPYEHISKEIMEKIDAHIYSQINKNAQIEKHSKEEKKISKISPGESFEHYLLENKEELLNELRENKKVTNQNNITKEECENLVKKYKKTYKNRFYNIRVSLNK